MPARVENAVPQGMIEPGGSRPRICPSPSGLTVLGRDPLIRFGPRRGLLEMRTRICRTGRLREFTHPQPTRRCRALVLEPLEDRKLLTTFYVDDNWADIDHPGGVLTNGDHVANLNDTISPGAITAV